MKEKQQFKLKLNKIQKALFLYSDETYKDIALSDFELFGINVRYACMLQALLDVHYGTLKQQRSATAYFQSALFTEHCREVGIRKELMLYIIENPDSYANTIVDYDFEEGYEILN